MSNSARKSVALVAHDAMKASMVAWAGRHRELLASHCLYATGTTGGRIVEELGLEVRLLKSGPHGGDAQLGAMIAEGKLDMLIFFVDPLSSQPHDVDVKALIRLAVLYDVVLATNAATGEFVLTSPLMLE
ncbi:MAG: methylglyoxal synthase [Hyphomicrobiaceae bacterium]